MHISEIKWRSEIQWLTVCEHAWKRERERERLARRRQVEKYGQ